MTAKHETRLIFTTQEEGCQKRPVHTPLFVLFRRSHSGTPLYRHLLDTDTQTSQTVLFVLMESSCTFFKINLLNTDNRHFPVSQVMNYHTLSTCFMDTVYPCSLLSTFQGVCNIYIYSVYLAKSQTKSIRHVQRKVTDFFK